MPELPEVETVVRGLQAVLPGRRILAVRFDKTDFIENPELIEEELPQSRIIAVRRYGKFLVFDLEPSRESGGATALLIHLGMTGKLITHPPGAPVMPHTHVFFSLDDGRELRYTDVRRFGSIRFLPKGVEGSLLSKLGLDPLEATETAFLAQLRGRPARIKALLLNQTILRGMGNIYTDESLWRAGIHPARLATNLKADELHRLYNSMQHVLKEAIRLKGSSISDYVDSEGRRGTFQLRHRVYQRRGKKCFRCGNAIQRVIVAGRSSYFCPGCQKPPRQRVARRAPTSDRRKSR
jgi:formamidopyrimidine-DNA glycosylase